MGTRIIRYQIDRYRPKDSLTGIQSCKNRHPYDKRNADTTTRLNLPKFEKSDRETKYLLTLNLRLTIKMPTKRTKLEIP